MTPDFQTEDLEIYIGDVVETLKQFPDESIDCVVTSPPYWGLRNYGVEGQFGSEFTPQEFVNNLLKVFSEIHRVLAPHGTVWLNLGDTYAANRTYQVTDNKYIDVGNTKGSKIPKGLKSKDLIGIPWRVALALQDDGWYLRSDIIWSKPNPMPESVRDRPTKAHEYIFLLTKNSKYWWDKVAASEPAKWERWGGQTTKKIDPMARASVMVANRSKKDIEEKFDTSRRNMRSVWEITTKPYKKAHFATFPEDIPKRAIEAGCPIEVCIICGDPRMRIVENKSMVIARSDRGEKLGEFGKTQASGQMLEPAGTKTIGWTKCKCVFPSYRKGIVLDPFAGSGTTMKVARDLGRKAIGIDLQPDYLPLMLERNGYV